MKRRPILGLVAPALVACFLLASAVPCQSISEVSSLEPQLEQFQKLILDNRLAEAERLVRRILPAPESERKDTGGFPNLSGYNLAWGILANRYLSADDYADAERVAQERLKLAEAAAPADSYRIQLFTFLLANIYLTEGNYSMARPVYERLNSADVQNNLAADFQVKSNVGMTEVFMALGRPADAEHFLKPMVFVEGADPARPAAFHEEIFNTYAVALAEAGQGVAAAQMVAQIGRESSRPEGFDAQDRDLLRARLLRTRGSFPEAEAIYRMWIKHWDDRPAARGSLRRDLAEPRLKPLQEYSHFLTLRRRLTEAQGIRVRVRTLEREYDITF